MAIVWPGTLPQDLLAGASESRQKGRLTTQMDVGTPKMRRRFTAVSRYIKGAIIVDGAQQATLDTFWETTLAEGVKQFDWKDPKDASTKSFRFRSEIDYENVQPEATTTKRLWRAVLDLELLP